MDDRAGHEDPADPVQAAEEIAEASQQRERRGGHRREVQQGQCRPDPGRLAEEVGAEKHEDGLARHLGMRRHRRQAGEQRAGQRGDREGEYIGMAASEASASGTDPAAAAARARSYPPLRGRTRRTG